MLQISKNLQSLKIHLLPNYDVVDIAQVHLIFHTEWQLPFEMARFLFQSIMSTVGGIKVGEC